MNWLAKPTIGSSGCCKKWLVLFCFLIGTGLVVEGGWIHAKALLAQRLIEQAWSESLELGKPVKPWPWADTWPVARLESKRLGVDLYVLSGGHGSALAFGPGLLQGADNQGGEYQGVDHKRDEYHSRPIIMAGHRDTHFDFLKELKEQDELWFTDQLGKRQSYTVTGLKVEDSKYQQLQVGARQLVLVTCYPFDALRAGGNLRYVVRAKVKTKTKTHYSI